MCAINGCTTNDLVGITQMNSATQHRGPDGSKILTSDQFCFGHNRLAIIDLSNEGLQPRTSNDGRYTIVFNGEIYNYQELREELKTLYQFTTKTDTEVLLAAYTVWGNQMFPRLRGIFAFAIFDSKEKRLLLARDQMGVKPLYYYFDGADLYFSSEMQGLQASIKNKLLNASSATLYLGMQYVPSPQTLVEDIKKLQPGHTLTWKRDEGIVVERYFYPEVKTKSVCTTEQVYATIDQAVKRQLVSDRPIGTFLSGGLDSSVVLHHMAQYSDSVRTFSVDFEMVAGAEKESEKFNTDAVLAERTAGMYGATHTTFHISVQDIQKNLESILEHVDEPIANPTVISQYFLSKWVREQGIVVALGGDGGDELFGGYTRHRAFISAYLYQYLPSLLQQMGALLHPRFKKLQYVLPLELHREVMLTKASSISPVVKNNHDLRKSFDTEFNERYEAVDAPNAMDAFLVVDRESWLADESLARSDRTSMLHGVELRVPLLDLDVVTMADRISVWQKTSPFQGKKIIRNTYRKYLPPYIFDQPKRGWISPGAKWLRDPVINSFAREVLSSGYYSGLDDLIDWQAVQTLLENHTNHSGYYLHPIWNIMQLQVWAKKHKLKLQV